MKGRDADVRDISQQEERTWRGSFPSSGQKTFARGEKVVWEGRPSFMIVLMRPIVLTVLALILAFIILGNSGPAVTLLAAVIVGAVMIPLNRRFGDHSGNNWYHCRGHRSGGRGFLFTAGPSPDSGGIIPLVLTYLQWRHTTLAATDRRLIAQYGLLNLAYADTGIDNVQTIKISNPGTKERWASAIS